MKRKIVIWGSSIEYDHFRKLLEVELYKGTIQIIGIVLNEEKLFSKMDGIEVLTIESLLWLEFDYIVNLNQAGKEEVLKILELLRISRDKVIPIAVFRQPYFDFQRWEQVKNSRISIVASHCWGGFTYNALGLQFQSPFVNLFVGNTEFVRLVGSLRYYMEQPLRYVGENYEKNLKRNYPMGQLGDVLIHFNHYQNFDEAVACWNERKERINYNNLLIEMTANSREELESFLQLPYEHKICFTMLPCQEKNVVSIQNENLLSLYNHQAWDFANRTAAINSGECKQVDLLKLLNHEEDYMRVEYV